MAGGTSETPVLHSRLLPCRLAEIISQRYVMPDEAPLRSGGKSNSGDGAQGGAGEPASLQGRAPFLADWRWDSIVRINERLCSGGRAQHGKNSETHASCKQEWTQGNEEPRTLLETLDRLRSFHKRAAFLFLQRQHLLRNRAYSYRCPLRRIPAGSPPRSRLIGGALCGWRTEPRFDVLRDKRAGLSRRFPARR